MAALNLTGASTQITSIPTAVLAAQNIEGNGLVLRGRKSSAVWCSAGGLASIARLAEPYNVNHVANWIGYAPLRSILAETNKAGDKFSRSNRRIAATLSLLVLALCLGIGTLRAAGTETSNNTTAGISKLVINNAACGAGLLHTLHLSAEAAGYAVSTSQARARMVSDPKFDLLLPALVVTPAADSNHPAKALLLPVTATIGAGEKLTFSLHLVPTQADKTPDAEITLKITRNATREVLAQSTTTTSTLGWTLALVSWRAPTRCYAGTLAVEITIRSTKPVKITFPGSFVVKL